MGDPNRAKYYLVLNSEHSDNHGDNQNMHPRFEWTLSRQILPASKIRMLQFNGSNLNSTKDTSNGMMVNFHGPSRVKDLVAIGGKRCGVSSILGLIPGEDMLGAFQQNSTYDEAGGVTLKMGGRGKHGVTQFISDFPEFADGFDVTKSTAPTMAGSIKPTGYSFDMEDLGITSGTENNLQPTGWVKTIDVQYVKIGAHNAVPEVMHMSGYTEGKWLLNEADGTATNISGVQTVLQVPKTLPGGPNHLFDDGNTGYIGHEGFVESGGEYLRLVLDVRPPVDPDAGPTDPASSQTIGLASLTQQEVDANYDASTNPGFKSWAFSESGIRYGGHGFKDGDRLFIKAHDAPRSGAALNVLARENRFFMLTVTVRKLYVIDSATVWSDVVNYPTSWPATVGQADLRLQLGAGMGPGGDAISDSIGNANKATDAGTAIQAQDARWEVRINNDLDDVAELILIDEGSGYRGSETIEFDLPLTNESGDTAQDASRKLTITLDPFNAATNTSGISRHTPYQSSADDEKKVGAAYAGKLSLKHVDVDKFNVGYDGRTVTEISEVPVGEAGIFVFNAINVTAEDLNLSRFEDPQDKWWRANTDEVDTNPMKLVKQHILIGRPAYVAGEETFNANSLIVLFYFDLNGKDADNNPASLPTGYSILQVGTGFKSGQKLYLPNEYLDDSLGYLSQTSGSGVAPGASTGGYLGEKRGGSVVQLKVWEDTVGITPFSTWITQTPKRYFSHTPSIPFCLEMVSHLDTFAVSLTNTDQTPFTFDGGQNASFSMVLEVEE